MPLICLWYAFELALWQFQTGLSISTDSVRLYSDYPTDSYL